MAEIGVALKGMMKARKLSAPKLAERSGVPLGSIKSILTGQSKNPRANTLQALARAFDCNVSELFTTEIASVEESVLVNTASYGIIPATPRVMIALEEEDRLFKEAIMCVDSVAREKGFDLNTNPQLRNLYIEKAFLFACEVAAEQGTAAGVDKAYVRWLVGKEYC